MKLLAAIPGFFLLLSAAVTADDGVDACDLAAGHPSDPDHVGPGVATRDVVAHIAIPACRAAVEREPGNPRFHYQLGRAIVYWADANNGDDSEGVCRSESGFRYGLPGRPSLYWACCTSGLARYVQPNP